MAYVKPASGDLDEVRKTLEAIAEEHPSMGRGHILVQEGGTAFDVPDEMADLLNSQMGYAADDQDEDTGDEETEEEVEEDEEEGDDEGPATGAPKPPPPPRRPGRPKNQTTEE